MKNEDIENFAASAVLKGILKELEEKPETYVDWVYLREMCFTGEYRPELLDNWLIKNKLESKEFVIPGDKSGFRKERVVIRFSPVL